MIIKSLKHELYKDDDIHMGMKYESGDTIIHLMYKGGHIFSYSLLRLNPEGVMRFKSIGAGTAIEYKFNKMEFDIGKKLKIIGVDDI